MAFAASRAAKASTLPTSMAPAVAALAVVSPAPSDVRFAFVPAFYAGFDFARESAAASSPAANRSAATVRTIGWFIRS
jgi:hypothetical protein